MLAGRVLRVRVRSWQLKVSQPNVCRTTRHHETRRNYSQSHTDRSAVGVSLPCSLLAYSRFNALTTQALTPKSAALFIAVGIGLFFYFRHEKQKLLEQRGKVPSHPGYP
jgi:protein SCO1/2